MNSNKQYIPFTDYKITVGKNNHYINEGLTFISSKKESLLLVKGEISLYKDQNGLKNLKEIFDLFYSYHDYFQKEYIPNIPYSIKTTENVENSINNLKTIFCSHYFEWNDDFFIETAADTISIYGELNITKNPSCKNIISDIYHIIDFSQKELEFLNKENQLPKNINFEKPIEKDNPFF